MPGGGLGALQGSILSPILSNIYLHELDEFMQKQQNELSSGKRRKANPEYRRLCSRISTLQLKFKKKEVKRTSSDSLLLKE